MALRVLVVLFHADQTLLMILCVVGAGVEVIPTVQTICHGSGERPLKLVVWLRIASEQ
jgi:hypothetical protein